jgi:hypothetical protein
MFEVFRYDCNLDGLLANLKMLAKDMDPVYSRTPPRSAPVEVAAVFHEPQQV